MHTLNDAAPNLAPPTTRARRRRAPKPCALHGTGAVNLNYDELTTISAALAILDRKLIGARDVFQSPASIKQWLTLHYGLLNIEVFGLLLLDSQHRLLAHEQLFTGTVSSTSVYPREVARCVFVHNAAACVAVHCHPSGLSEPSAADRTLTTTLRNTLALLDVRLLDHFIVAGNEILSFAERGLL